MAKAKKAVKKAAKVVAPVVPTISPADAKKAALALMANTLKMQDASGHKIRPEQIDEFHALAVKE